MVRVGTAFSKTGALVRHESEKGFGMWIFGRIRRTIGQYTLRFIGLRLEVPEIGEWITAKGKLKVCNRGYEDIENATFYFGDMECRAHVERVRDTRTGCVCDIRLALPKSAIYSLPIHNTVEVELIDRYGTVNRESIMFDKRIPVYLAKRTGYYRDETAGLVAFFRQNAGKGTTFTVRHENITDSKNSQIQLVLAWLASKIAVWINPILLFEKNGRHYEESARAVFEKMLDFGYKKAFFVLSDDVRRQSKIDNRYKGNILSQHSFKHYLYFFRCRKFIGTESCAHALELRCQNLLVQRKLKSRGNTFVFLQHGVMYMVSLDSPQRTSFQRKAQKGVPYVVVSSEKEADHFIDLGGFERDELIVCGLPKFDRSYLNEGADKILIMPTWRIWEFNKMRHNPQETKYVKMIERMVQAMPQHLQEKVVVARHPLFVESTFLSSFTQEILSYDEMLRDVSVLITDYSSIAYDSFYRGSNVIFYWEEKDECMSHYGENTHLMLTEESAFGPVCFNGCDLHDAVDSLYGKPQDKLYLDRYRQIVEFHDGENTIRLIEALRAKKIID